EKLNAALAPFDLVPTHEPAAARARDRYVLENDQHVDVLVAKQQSTKDGEVVRFEDVWARRKSHRYDATVPVPEPAIDDLIRTKKWSMRQRDVADIQLLEALARRERGAS